MRLPLVILISAWASAACAQNAKILANFTPAYDSCLAKADSTLATEVCANAENAVWDRRLNAAYARIMASPNWNPQTKTLVRDAQRAWLAYRAAKCDAAGQLDAEGGTLSGVSTSICVAAETESRAAELEGTLGKH